VVSRIDGTSLGRRAFGAVAMAFVALLAVSASVPAYAVNPEASSPAPQNAARSAGIQSLQVSAGATVAIQRDGYSSAAAPKPTPVVRSQAAGISQGWVSPESGRIGSPFGPRPNAPVAGVSAFHKGTDIVAACGKPVFAAAAGTVIETGYRGSYGNWILIDHGNGIQTGYAHSSRILVSVGQRVASGARIALVGATGAATGCHVHFETRVNGTAVNPVLFMSARGISLG
jgi:murein DD-endopeptidase MepM/ murein hydrolase activator NlpD